MSENLSNLLPLIIWTLILALLIPVSRIRIGYTFNPAAIFVLVWLAALWTNRLPELELYPPSTESLNLICLSILGFAIGFLLVVGKFKEHLYSTASFGSYLIANNRFSKVSLIASVILVLVVAKLALPGISNVLSDTESAAKVRAAVSEDGGISILKKAGGIWASKYGVILLEYMVFPGVYTLFGLNLARCIISGTKSSILILLLACLGMVLLDLLAFSRFQCLFIALTFLVGLFFGGHMWSAGQPRLKARQAGAFLWFIKFGILGCIALLMTISLLRMRGNMDMSKLSDDPLYYFSQPFTLFDMRSDVLVKDNFVYSVGGFCDLFNNFWTMILRHREIFFVRTMDLQTMVNIAPARQANAHYTWCLPFYQDFGMSGTFILPALYGMVTGLSFSAYRKSADAGKLVAFIYLFAIGLLAILEWRFTWGEFTAEIMPIVVFAVLRWPGQKRYSHQWRRPIQLGDQARKMAVKQISFKQSI